MPSFGRYEVCGELVKVLADKMKRSSASSVGLTFECFVL
jgi:hypothetical protein